MLLATYRSDELDRRHPLTRTAQVWRRAGLAETVAVGAMSPAQVTEMISAILDAEEVSGELAALVHARAEGNPFVLEEMLREAELELKGFDHAQRAYRLAAPLPAAAG